MLVLRAFVQDGVVPLLGPKTSVGVFHHGALEYFLLAPAAWLSGAEPLGIVLEFAVIGIAAVAATWWLGRVVGGSRVALVAGMLLAVSPAAVDESTFIWNPNPVPLFAAIAAAAAWRGRQVGGARWWALAVACAAAVANLHVLGAIFVPPILALLVVDLRRWWRPDPRRARRALGGAALGLVVAVLIYLPFLVSELRTGFAESRAIADYIAAGGGATSTGLLERVVVTGLRVIGWPFVGLVTDVPLVASLVVGVVAALLGWLAVAGRGDARAAGRWIAGTVAWTIVALAVAAPSLANVVPGLPNDHYHSFVDPLVVLGLALAGAELANRAGLVRSARPAAPRLVAGALLVSLAGFVAIALWRQPGMDPNGGWPAARAAGEAVAAMVSADAGADGGSGAAGVAVLNLPDFEPPTWISYPIVYAADHAASPAASVALEPDPSGAEYVVLGCDRLFEAQIGAACGGPADAIWLPRLASTVAPRLDLMDRFDLSPRISVAVYRVR